MMKQDDSKYEDMLYMSHPVSKKHPPMKRENRAAQFAPFAALTGHNEILLETQRITDRRKILDETKKLQINDVLQRIVVSIKQQPLVRIQYFVEDVKKEGGKYLTETKQVKKLDEYLHRIHFVDHTIIDIEDIYDIELVSTQ